MVALLLGLGVKLTDGPGGDLMPFKFQGMRGFGTLALPPS